jgi:hypothetical protein
MEPKGFPETSIRNYRHSLRSKPEQRGSRPLHGGSLESLTMQIVFVVARPSTVQLATLSVAPWREVARVLSVEHELREHPLCS